MEDNSASRTNLGQLLLQAFHWFDDGLLNKLREAGWPEITRAHSMIFAHIEAEGTRSSELARRIGVSRQAVHQTVTELVDIGLVEFVPDPASRRAKLVVLTSQGKKNVEAAQKAFTELEAELIRRIGRGNVDALRRALKTDWGQPYLERY